MGTKLGINIIVALVVCTLFPVALAHETTSESQNAYVRVVDANPSTHTYTFACVMNNTFLRDWAIRADTGDTSMTIPNEAEINDLAHDEYLVYTFDTDEYYHIGCQIVREPDFDKIWRGDLHMDLRPNKTSWNPQIVPLGGNGLTATLECRSNSSNTPSWEVLNAQTGEQTPLGNTNPLVHTVAGHGLYDYFCNVGGNSTGYPVEFFDDHNPYYANDQGVPFGVTRIWNPEPTTYEIPDGLPVPSVQLTANSTSSGWNLFLDTQNFVFFQPEGDMAPHVDGEGHAHWYLDGVKQGRIYEPIYSTDNFSVGEHEIHVRLSTNNHKEYTSGGDFIQDSVIVVQEDAQTEVNDTVPQNDTQDNSTCYQSLHDLPVQCGNATILSDISTGCRTVLCEDQAGSIQILACEKPNIGEKQYFEMYKQETTGTPPQVCIGNICIQHNGFAQSSTYPICLATENNQTLHPEDNTSTDEFLTCTDHTADAPCELISNTITGCQVVQYADANGTAIGIQAQACLKDGNVMEVSRQAYFSTHNLEVCFSGVCVDQNWGFRSGVITTQNDTNNDTTIPVPQWIEPTQGLTDVTLDYFHLAANPPSDDTNIVSSDWEVWTEDFSSLVWTAYENTGLITYHTHTPDGNFIGDTTKLSPDTSYQVRVRYASQDTNGSWAEWRKFTTRSASSNTSSISDWTAKQGFYVEKFASGFDVPVHLAFAPQQYTHLPEYERPYLYVTELYGTIKVVYSDGNSSVYADNLLNFDPFGSITGAGQMGLTSLYVDDSTGNIYTGTVYIEQGEVYNKILKFTSNENGSGYTQSQVLLDGIVSAPSHQIQQITRGPDERLYVNLGEGLAPANAQNDSILAGKIIAMNDDGSNVTIYAKGFRNPFGADWRPGYNTLYVTDNAPDTDDRLVKVVQGENYGWGLPDEMQTFHEKRIDTLNVSPVDVEFNPGLVNFSEFYVAVAGPIYQQGPTTGKHILEYVLDDSGQVASREIFVTYTGDGYGTPMGLDFGPDGLYFTDIYGEPGFVGLGKTEANIYRVLSGNPRNQTQETGIFRAGISIISWYPKDTGDGIEYIFECQGIDGSGNHSYGFDLGTGGFSIIGSRQYVKYPYADMNHTVTCFATDMSNNNQASASMTINPSKFIAE